MTETGNRNSGSNTSIFNWERHDDGEHPAVVIDDVRRKPRPTAHVITFANETAGSGKTTLAFHCAVALANAGAKVLAIDLDGQKQSLSKALGAREVAARALGVALPNPKCGALHRPSAALIHQEIARLGTHCRFVIIDTPSRDTPSSRRAIAMADTLVTPVDSHSCDLKALATGEAARQPGTQPGHFGKTVGELHANLKERGFAMPDWMLVPTRAKAPKGSRAPHIRKPIREAAKLLNMRLSTALPQSAAYCDLFSYGLALNDLRRIPGFADHSLGQDRAIERLLAEMRLPLEGLDGARDKPLAIREIPRTMRRYSANLREEVGALAAAL